ncbi:MAG: GDP-mannose 4,6-dehydratase [Verrucomicrobiae bacterium]
MSSSFRCILVTGAAGCAGRHLLELALTRGVELHGIVRSHRASTNCHLHVGDISESHFIDSVIEEVRPDAIFHLAAKIPGGTPAPTPEEFITSNILGTHNVLSAVCRRAPSARVLVAGSSAVYGRPQFPDEVLSETAPFQPQSIYAVTKAAQDMLAAQFFTEYGLLTIRARTFNQIGPGEPSGLVAATLARQIVRIETGLQEPILHVGTLLPSRDFTDVRDVVRAYWDALEHGVAGEAYNVCAGQTTSVRDLADALVGLSRIQNIEIIETGPPPGPLAILTQKGDASKLSAASGWTAKLSIRQSLKDLLDSLRTLPPLIT